MNDLPTNTPTAECPWCHVADIAVESEQIVDRIITGFDKDNGPIYWAECQRCGAQGPIVDWAADAIPKWNESRPQTATAPATVSEDALRFVLQCMDGHIDLAGSSLFAWHKSDKPEAKDRIAQVEADVARKKSFRAEIAAALQAALGRGDGWIACSERMPPDFCDDMKDPGEPTEVFVCDKTGKRWMDFIIYRSHSGKREWCRRNTVPPNECHWRVLPKPPAAKGQP